MVNKKAVIFVLKPLSPLVSSWKAENVGLVSVMYDIQLESKTHAVAQTLVGGGGRGRYCLVHLHVLCSRPRGLKACVIKMLHLTYPPFLSSCDTKPTVWPGKSKFRRYKVIVGSSLAFVILNLNSDR